MSICRFYPFTFSLFIFTSLRLYVSSSLRPYVWTSFLNVAFSYYCLFVFTPRTPICLFVFLSFCSSYFESDIQKSVWWMVNEVDCPTSPNTSWLKTPGIPCGIEGKRWAFHLKEKFLKQKWDWFYAPFPENPDGCCVGNISWNKHRRTCPQRIFILSGHHLDFLSSVCWGH